MTSRVAPPVPRNDSFGVLDAREMREAACRATLMVAFFESPPLQHQTRHWRAVNNYSE
jgi:hypothetical protein